MSSQVQASIEGLSEVAKLQVSSVRPASTPAKFVVVETTARATTDRESGKKKEIKPENRYRCVVIPELTVDGVPSKFQKFVLDMLYSIAKSQLSDLWDEHGDLMTQVDAAIWNVDALLLYAARKAESKKLSGETILSWFAASELRKKLAEKYNEAQLKALANDLVTIAVAVIPWSEEKLLKRIALLGTVEDDAVSDIGSAMIRKMSNRLDAIRKEREALGEIDGIEL